MTAQTDARTPDEAPREARKMGAVRLLAGFVRDVGGVLLAWAFLVGVEFVVIGFTAAGLFAGNWELVLGRKLVGPIALAMLVPGAVAVVAVGRVLGRAGERPAARVGVAGLAGAVLGAVGVGVSQGRHFASLALRVPFVVALAASAFAATYVVAPRVARQYARAGAGARVRVLALASGVLGAAVFWLVDARVLPRLYPAFHALAFALTLAFAALTILAWRTPLTDPPPRGEFFVGLAGLLLAVAACVWSPFAARRLERSDNLRLILEERAPILGRAVHVAAWLAPPVPLDEGATDASAPAVGEVPRALDWSGEDILLVSVDALRADHLGAYGYGRPTTPNLDALAKEGAVFEHAYCPTPHTSYSVTSMMTGKAMRPLLSLGLGKESDTWATYLRRYGYKTAAFYPPAVFYIDADRFTEFEKTSLGFEYRWVEFTSAEEKVAEVARYLETAGPEPLFAWVHLFEPHEPYVQHPGHDFGEGVGTHEVRMPVDAYDSEVAYADAAIGELLRVVRAKRGGRKLAVIVTADHGEEFGEHGGRYHGTTCYEEQVRVPLLVSGPGVVPRRVPTVVQTIDLLPTVLSALGIPRPARVRGRDLGRVLANVDARGGGQTGERLKDPGLAYAETDDQSMLARGDLRLLCARKISACALYDVRRDPEERVDRAASMPAVARELRAMTAAIERDHGRYEAADVAWPDALRRGLQGEADAAEDVAGLLDDANVVIRRKAAEVTFRLAAPPVLAQATRAAARDEDEEVKRWASLGVVRIGAAAEAPARALAQRLVKDDDPKWRRAASLAFALQGDPRGKAELAAWWRDEGPTSAHADARLDTADAKELLVALARIRAADAVLPLLASLDYVPLRPRIAETLGAIGDARARPPLLALFEKERYETARPFEARALLALGAGKELLTPLALFAGLADPMTEAFPIAAEAKLLDERHGGRTFDPPVVDVDLSVGVAGPLQPRRLWVLAAEEGGELSGSVGGEAIASVKTSGAVHVVGVDARPDPPAPKPLPWACPPARVPGEEAERHSVALHLHEPKGIRAVWVVPRQPETPAFLLPPVPDAGAARAASDASAPPR